MHPHEQIYIYLVRLFLRCQIGGAKTFLSQIRAHRIDNVESRLQMPARDGEVSASALQACHPGEGHSLELAVADGALYRQRLTEGLRRLVGEAKRGVRPTEIAQRRRFQRAPAGFTTEIDRLFEVCEGFTWVVQSLVDT